MGDELRFCLSFNYVHFVILLITRSYQVGTFNYIIASPLIMISVHSNSFLAKKKKRCNILLSIYLGKSW